MKGPIEVYPIILFGMAFVLLGFSMFGITMNYNNARIYQESIISLIEKHNRYDEDIDDLINSSEYKCKTCTYDVSKSESKYIVNVFFEITIPVIQFRETVSIKSLTQSIS